MTLSMVLMRRVPYASMPSHCHVCPGREEIRDGGQPCQGRAHDGDEGREDHHRPQSKGAGTPKRRKPKKATRPWARGTITMVARTPLTVLPR
jgi:hypothetical protein